MNLDKFLNTTPLRNLRDAAATIRAVVFVVTIITAAAVLLYLTFGREWIEPSVALTAGIALAVVSMMIVFFACYSKYIHDPPFYEILELEGLLIVEPVGDHHRYVYTRRQRVRATRDDRRLIEIRGHWTGVSSRGKLKVESLVADHALLDSRSAEEDGRVHRWIYPRRPIGKGREVEVGIRQEHEDDIQPQLPYFREGGGRYRTHKITVTARFPKSEDPNSLGEVEGKVWNTRRPITQTQPVADITPIRKVDSAAGIVDYVVTVGRPKLFHSYGITWRWPHQPEEPA